MAAPVRLGFDDDDDPHFSKGKSRDKNRPSLEEQTQSFELSCAGGSLSICVFQWAQGADVKQKTLQGATPIMWASYKNNLAIVKFLLERGADCNDRAPDGQSPLSWAAGENCLLVGKLLLEHGASCDVLDVRGYSPYTIAVQNGNLGFLHMLQLHKPYESHNDNEGHTLLHWAAYRGHVHIARYCVEVLKVNPQGLDQLKRTALHWAAREGQAQVCTYLMSVGLSPTLLDSEGVTPAQWATKRKHRETAAVLSHNQTTPINRACGTLALMVRDTMALAHALAAVIFFIGSLVWTHYIPPCFAHSYTFGYVSKNVASMHFFRLGESTTRDPMTLAEEIGVPRTLVGAFRGTAVLRGREPANIFAFLTLLGCQYVVAVAAEVPLSQYYMPLLITVLCLVVMTKLRSGAQVVQAGTLQDDPTLKAVERQDFASLDDRIILSEQHLRIPLRAFYCKEYDAVIRRFDSYSALLDCPIGESNQIWFVLLTIAATAHQIVVLHTSWSHYSAQYCPATEPFSLCSTIYHLFFSALPCAQPLTNPTWMEWLMPTAHNQAGVYLIIYSLMAVIIFGFTFYRQLECIANGITRYELRHPMAPSTAGGLQPIIQNGRWIYSEGSLLVNLITFCLGRQGRRWKDHSAIPAVPI